MIYRHLIANPTPRGPVSWDGPASWNDLLDYLYPTPDVTHEMWIEQVKTLSIGHAMRQPGPNGIGRALLGREVWELARIKMTYGYVELRGLFGATYIDSWTGPDGVKRPLVAIYGSSQIDLCLLAYTVVHELGHALAMIRDGAHHDGHGPKWRDATRPLGLVDPTATYKGTHSWTDLDPSLAAAIQSLVPPNDGIPKGYGPILNIENIPRRTCTAGRGVRGGRSEGTGSGSRNVVYRCGCVKGNKSLLDGQTLHGPHKVSAARNVGKTGPLMARCLHSGTDFTLDPDSLPATDRPLGDTVWPDGSIGPGNGTVHDDPSPEIVNPSGVVQNNPAPRRKGKSRSNGKPTPMPDINAPIPDIRPTIDSLPDILRRLLDPKNDPDKR